MDRNKIVIFVMMFLIALPILATTANAVPIRYQDFQYDWNLSEDLSIDGIAHSMVNSFGNMTCAGATCPTRVLTGTDYWQQFDGTNDQLDSANNLTIRGGNFTVLVKTTVKEYLDFGGLFDYGNNGGLTSNKFLMATRVGPTRLSSRFASDTLDFTNTPAILTQIVWFAMVHNQTSKTTDIQRAVIANRTGVYVANQTSTRFFSVTSKPSKIGKDSEAGGTNYRGNVSEIIILNRTLSPSDIQGFVTGKYSWANVTRNLTGPGLTGSQKVYINFTNDVSSTVVQNVWDAKFNGTKSTAAGFPIHSTNYPTFGTSGTGVNSSMNFVSADGQFVVVSSVFDPDTSNAGFAFGGWFNITSNTTGQQLFAIGANGACGGTWIGVNSNKYLLRVGDSGVCGMDYTTISGPIPQNKWVHVFLDYNSSGRLYLFVNGVVKSNTTALSTANNNNHFYLGQRGDTVNFVNGKLDEVKLYNKSLKPSQVLSIYNIGSPTPSGGGGSAPIISAVNVSGKTTTSAVINWTTDISSNTTLKYGTTKSITNSRKIDNSVTAHNVTLTGLSSNTRYFFNVSSCATSLCAVSGSYNFTTKSVNIGSIISFYPFNNTQFSNNNLTVSTLVNITTGPTNVSFFINGQKNRTVSTSSGVHNVTFNRLFATSHNPYNLSIQLQRDTFTSNSSKHIFYVDSVSPIATTTFINQSVYYRYGNNFTTQFNLSDINLFSYNVTINNVQKYAQTGLSSSFFQVNLSQKPNQFKSNLRNNLTIKVADGHTSNSLIDTWQFDYDSNNLAIGSTQEGEEADIPILSRDHPIGKVINYLIPLDRIFPGLQSNLQHISIDVLDGSNNDVFTTTQKSDRYTFSYTPESPRNTYQFEVTSDTELFVVNKPESQYKSWIVTGDKWVDFLLEGEPYEEISIEKTGTNTAIVTITGLQNTNVLNFKSIGELNIVTKTYTFFVFANNAPGYKNLEREISYSRYNLTINKSSELTSTARLIYNGTVYPASSLTNTTTSLYTVWNKTLVTPRITVSHTYNASWNYSVSSGTSSASRVVKFTQKVSEFNLTNCSSSPSRPGINFTVSDVDLGTPIGSLRTNGLFTIWTDPALSPLLGNKVKNFSIFSTTNSTVNVFKACVNTNKNLSVGWTLNYASTISGYNTGQSVVQSLVTGQSPQNITNTTSRIFPLYLTSSASAVVIDLIDRFGSNLVGYFIKMWLVRPGFPDILTTSFITDYKGEWQVSYNPIKSYRFDVYNPSQSLLLFTTGTTIITTNPFVIQIPNSQNDLQSLQTVTTLSSNVSCKASTKTCRFDWNNRIITDAKFEIFRVNGWGSTLINNSIKHASSGTLSYTVTENTTGNSYHAVGYIDTNTSNSFYVVGQADLLSGSGIFANLGDTSTVIFVGFFLVLTLALLLIDIGPVGLVIGMLIGLLAGSILGVVPITIAGFIALACVLLVGLWYGKS